MWVFEEEVDGRKLTEIINTDHENVKYLPGSIYLRFVCACARVRVCSSLCVFVRVCACLRSGARTFVPLTLYCNL